MQFLVVMQVSEAQQNKTTSKESEIITSTDSPVHFFYHTFLFQATILSKKLSLATLLLSRCPVCFAISV